MSARSRYITRGTISMDDAINDRRGSSRDRDRNVYDRRNIVAYRHRFPSASGRRRLRLSLTHLPPPAFHPSTPIPTDWGCIHGIGDGIHDAVGYRRPSRSRGGELFWIGQTIRRRRFCHFFTVGGWRCQNLTVISGGMSYGRDVSIAILRYDGFM